MSDLKKRIDQDTIAAMKAGEKENVAVLRMLKAALKQKEVDERIELNDANITAILNKMLKQRRDALQQFTDAGREDLAKQEQFEIDLLSDYLPAQMSDAEIETAVKAEISALGAAGMQDMGKVMGALKGKLDGKADMSKVSQCVKASLAG